ncbi:aspartyl/asparaginyl beta-hydroxylase domain-containing protein [Flavitalea flava]
MIHYARLNLCYDHQAVQQEVRSLPLPEQWTMHFNSTDYTGSWTVISLRSPDGKETSIIPASNEVLSYADTPLMIACPAIKALLSQFLCPVMSVRLLNLEKGAVIKPHRDHELAFEKGEARLHFPIFTNDQVFFYSNSALLKMKEGECWYINVNLLHSVANKGSSDRIHLVVDCSVNDWLKELFGNAAFTEKIMDEEKEPGHLLAVITELRLQGTQTSLALAKQLEDRQ